jgi:ribosomal protein L37AE/L43A
MSRKFQRRIENFKCEHCGQVVTGNGYTNHCPHCLWSKHVDIHPGDRAAECGGLMQPLAVERKEGEMIILHECSVCQHRKRNRTAPEDNFALLLKLMAEGSPF